VDSGLEHAVPDDNGDREVERAVPDAAAARFLAIEASSGILLIVATVVALLWANSPWKDSYASFLNAEIIFDAGPVGFHLTLQEFVNDALMAFFFFVAGLEIKRELV
jgi:NhaA family Na+:H+ antiporter